MRIRTISGATLTEAMGRVREELGADAVILHIEDAKSKKGVIIRAASDAPSDVLPSTDDLDGPARPEIETRLERDLRLQLRGFQRAPEPLTPIDPALHIAPALAYHRVPPHLSAQILAKAAESGAGDDASALAHGLSRTMAAGPLPPRPAKPLIVLGAPGHGKSTVVARLGLHAVNAQAELIVATLDSGKAGAVSQIETFANLLKATAALTETPEALKGLTDRNAGRATLIVDTPGINLFDAQDLRDAQSWIAACGGEPVWVVSAEVDPEDAVEMARAAKTLGCRRAIVTKLDQARRLGVAPAIAQGGPLAIAFTVSSAFLAHGLEPFTPARYAQRLLQACARDADPLTDISAHTDFQEAMSA